MIDPTHVLRIRDFCTPASTGLRMYYATTPINMRADALSIPSCTVFTLHRAPVEDLVSRWRTGDIREIIREVGVPGPALNFEEAQACLARWSPAQRSTLDAYRVAIRAELLIGMELQIGADLQLVTSDALFSTLSYAAMQTLDWEVRACLQPWWDVEEQVTRGPTKAWPVFGALVAGVKAKVNSLLVATKTVKSSLPATQLPSLLKKGLALKSYAKAVASDFSVDGCFTSRHGSPRIV